MTFNEACTQEGQGEVVEVSEASRLKAVLSITVGRKVNSVLNWMRMGLCNWLLRYDELPFLHL